jgi:hypothetical protein
MLQELRFKNKHWWLVSSCLTVENQKGNPCPGVFPIHMGRGVYCLTIGASITFDVKKWETEKNRPQIVIKTLKL